jgi:CRP/FNR family transcriptional regulator, anaerobic regulatory protein
MHDATRIAAGRFTFHRQELLPSLVVGERKLRQLMQGTVLSLPAGRLLIRAGTDHEFVYRLRSGWACRNRAIADGRDQYILDFLPGDLFAVKSMFVPRHTDGVLILTDAIVERIHYKDLHRAFCEDMDIANRCIWQVVEEERRLHSSVFALGQGSADERLAYLLIDLRGRLVALEVIDPSAQTFPMPLTQEQMAGFTGITAIHVNRVLRGFREKNMATVRDGEAVIHDFARLSEVASPLLDTYERNSPAYRVSRSGEHTDD